MSYIVIGDNIVIDSNEVLKTIEAEFDFKEVKNITKGSNRDDTLIYQVTHDINPIKEEIESLGETLSEEELVEELMATTDEYTMYIEDVMPEGLICHGYSYHYDEGLGEIKSIFVAMDEQVGEKRLIDIVNRILKSVD
ncbi:MAG: hypothetical protein GX214_03720 [Clostridiales bacterium]|nr:hypothetical protein [Clostridiales bacterium]